MQNFAQTYHALLYMGILRSSLNGPTSLKEYLFSILTPYLYDVSLAANREKIVADLTESG